jgi:hypothetical protein
VLCFVMCPWIYCSMVLEPCWWRWWFGWPIDRINS